MTPGNFSLKACACIVVLLLAACVVPAGGVANAAPTSSPAPTWPEPTRTKAPASTPTATSRTTPTPAAWCLVETGNPAGTVYIRRGPGMSYPVVGYATQGERLELTGETNPAGWAEIRQAGLLVGWFYLKWCKEATR